MVKSVFTPASDAVSVSAASLVMVMSRIETSSPRIDPAGERVIPPLPLDDRTL